MTNTLKDMRAEMPWTVSRCIITRDAIHVSTGIDTDSVYSELFLKVFL
jgi:hypothetical protein